MKKSVAIIGGGASAIMAAAILDEKIFDVTIYEKNKTLGRKFLVAGDGGFNLTHSENIELLKSRYSPKNFLDNALNDFTNDDFRNWLERVGVPTFVGSSKRVYPEKGIKPIEVLNKILEILKKKKVNIKTEYTWNGWNDSGLLVFNNETIIQSDITILALGGGSWKVTGSDGNWIHSFKKKNIETKPFIPSNCAFQINWSNEFIDKNEGVPLKNISLRCGSLEQKGELVITRFGLEGNAIYALSSEIQGQLNLNQNATIFLDLKPTIQLEEIESRLELSELKTTECLKKKINLNSTQIQLLKSILTKQEFTNKKILAKKIKVLPLTVISASGLDEAISTMGGVDLNAINKDFELKQIPSNYCIGEMLDWNAPTGGYLLQASFSMSYFLASKLNQIN